MKIYLDRTLLPDLFPDAPLHEGDDILIRYLRSEYQVGAYIPAITITPDFIEIDIDESQLEHDNALFDRVVSLSERGKLEEAKKLIESMVEQGSYDSEVYRVYGQILNDLDDQDQVVDQFIEALRLNPENRNALLMLGTIYIKEKNDREAAMGFYERVLQLDPQNFYALNNVGGNLAFAGLYADSELTHLITIIIKGKQYEYMY